MDMGLIGKRYWIVEVLYKDGKSLEYKYDTREECRRHVRGANAITRRLKVKPVNLVSRKIYKVTVIHEDGTQVYKQPSS